MKEEMLFPDRESFRRWLSDNIGREEGVWLVFGKNKELVTLRAEEALEEALCYGWIDGQLRSINKNKYLKYFSPRRKGSNWSDKNRKLFEKLLAKGLMTERGLKVVERAREDGTWDVPKGPGISGEDMDAFAELIKYSSTAFENFQKMPLSVRKQFTGSYLEGKKEETRAKKLVKLVGLLEENKRPM